MVFFKNFHQTQLFKITSLNSFSVVLKITIGVISSKILAVFVGPSGLALVGNFKNFMSTIESFGSLGFQNGIIKYVAEKKDNKTELATFLSTILVCIFGVSIFLSFSLYAFGDFFMFQLFGDLKYAAVYNLVCLLLPFYIGSSVFLFIINGLGSFKKIIWLSIFGNCVGLILNILLVTSYHISGALLAFVATQAILFFINFYFLNKEIRIFENFYFLNFDIKIIKNLLDFSLMAFFSAIIVPIVFITIRNNIIADLGLKVAGYWVTIDLLSSYYFVFISTILTIYFLPKLSSTNSILDTRFLFMNYFKRIIPFFGAGLILVFILKSFIIKVLFTKEFVAMESLFGYQLMGDFFKACSLILAYNLIAKQKTKHFLLFEISSISILYLLTLWLIPIFGIQGIVISHCTNYIIYFLGLVFYHQKILFNSHPKLPNI